MSASIASSFSSGVEAYQHLVAALAKSSPPIHDEISLSELEDELGRLKVWAGNIAAHKTGRSSLDFRLRDASPLRDRIIGLLQDMEILLREAIKIVTGDRKPQDEAASDTDSSEDELSGEQGQSADQPRPTTELQQTQLDIVDIIDCLYKLSITIRNPSPHDRLVKASTVDTLFYEQWDIQHVKNKFPAAKESLAVKMGKAISRRRQHLKYREKHRKKLGQDLAPLPKAEFGQHALASNKVIPIIAVASGEFNDHMSAPLPSSEAAPSIVATTVLTQTTASEFYGGNTEFEVESDSGQTQTSYATSVGHEGSLSIPPLPKESQGGKPFECPYCYTIISVKNSHSWKKHLFRDLQPYVCSFESCSKGSKMFDSRHEWFDHELSAHRKEWYCSAGCEESFSLQSDFEDHMRQSHAASFSEHQLSALVDMCQRPIEEHSEAQCPFCNETIVSTKQLCRHLARHHEAMAIFALPRNKDDDKEEVFGSDKVQLSDASRGLSEGTLSFDSITKSTSDDSEMDKGVEGQTGPRDPHPYEISKLSDYFTDSDALPPSFMNKFQKEFRTLLSTDEDSAVLQIFEDAGDVILGPNFQQVMESKSNVKDLISLFYLEASTTCEKYQAGDDDKWADSLDEAAARFVQLMVRTATLSDVDILLILRLEKLEMDMQARLSQIQSLRAMEILGLPNPAEETHRLLDPDWAKSWALTEVEQKKFPDEDIAVQKKIHRLWTSEKAYVDGLDTLMILYRDDLIDNPSITEDGHRPEFIEKMFARVNRMRKIHKPLLGSLKARLLEQGPFVQSISEVFSSWVSPDVKEAYFQYAREFPSSEVLIQRAMKRSSSFRRTFEGESARIDWLKYLRSPMNRIQQCIRLLSDIYGANLAVTKEPEQLYFDVGKLETFYSLFEEHIQIGVEKASRTELAGKLVFLPGMEDYRFELDLEDDRRKIFYKGDLVRQIPNGSMIIILACLFDNYLLLNTPVKRRYAEDSDEIETLYDVTRMIPASLLVLGKGTDEYPLSTPKYLVDKGLDSTLLFPFKVQQLGRKETYTLFTTSSESRNTWCAQIMTALQAHASNETSEPKAPFSVNILGELSGRQKSDLLSIRTVTVEGSALDTAVKAFSLHPPPGQLWGTSFDVTCATTFNLSGLRLAAIGTEEGFHVGKGDNPRGWKGLMKLSNVKQIFAMEDFNLFVVLASSALWAYRADAVWDYFSGDHDHGSSAPKPPQRTEIAKGAKFFVAGQMKDRALLIYGKKESLHTVFRVLEPIYQKPAKKSLFSFRGSNTQPPILFREFDEFYLPTQSFGINMFNQYFAIHTVKGLEVISIDKKVPFSVPDLKESNVPNANRIKDEKSLGMFRLPNTEFFCCYEKTGVYVGKDGILSSSLVVEFAGNARKAAIDHHYIILFNDDFVEIRDGWNGELRQVIAGQNIRCLDDAQGGFRKRNVVFVMDHPDVADRLLVFELCLENTDAEAIGTAQKLGKIIGDKNNAVF